VRRRVRSKKSAPRCACSCNRLAHTATANRGPRRSIGMAPRVGLQGVRPLLESISIFRLLAALRNRRSASSNFLCGEIRVGKSDAVGNRGTQSRPQRDDPSGQSYLARLLLFAL
jgi:hypothetical protein